MRSSGATSLAAIATIALTLVLAGGFALLVGNMSEMLARFGQELQVTAYLEPELHMVEARMIAARVATVEGVHRVSLVSPEEAMLRFAQTAGATAMLEGLDGNPFPTSIEIALLPEYRTEQGVSVIEEALDGLPGIEDIAKGQEWIVGYTRATALVRFIAVGLGAVLAISALMIVANTIRLALYSRRDELEILSLVGASRTFVRVPFLLEGTLQGMAGGILAVVLLYVAFEVFSPQIQFGLSFFLGNAKPRFFELGELLSLVLGGATLGAIGSAAALLGWRENSG